MYAFLSHGSACEALRALGNTASDAPRWPAEPRELPRHRNTVTTQRMLAHYMREVDLASHGITSQPIDLLVPSATQRSRGARAYFHVWKHDVPARSMLRLGETLFVSSPEFVLIQMVGWHAHAQKTTDTFVAELGHMQEAYAAANINERVPYDDPFSWEQTVRLLGIVLVAMEFMGTYRLACGSVATTYQQQPLMTPASLTQFVAGIPHIYGANRLRLVQEFSLPNSASPMETALALMLSLPERYGGFGLAQPELNRSLPVLNHHALWDGGASITPDLLWQDAKLAVEYDSDEHHGSAGSRKLADDATRANVLSTLGYSVLRVTTLNIQTFTEVERLAHQVAGKLGTSLSEPDEVLGIRRQKLHALLRNH